MPRNFLFFVLIIFLILITGCTSISHPGPPPAPATTTGKPENLDTSLADRYPAPGELVDVNGSRIHIRCEGSGSPTVILEAGSSDCSLSWSRVQPGVSAFTRVCSYDRLGYGWSDPLKGSLKAADVTSRLHALLSHANSSPPYVLIGHSLGGAYVRAHAHRYPADVSGMVLVDPVSEWQMNRT